MIIQQYQFKTISPCFCGGATPDSNSEIRVPSIRGQLRWWFRTLGGFKSMNHQSIREQETTVFGSAAGDCGNAGKLVVRVKELDLKLTKKDSQAYFRPFTDGAYLLFPIQSKEDRNQRVTEDKSRPVIEPNSSFTLEIIWRGHSSFAPDIQGLVSVFSHFGSLGFRGRRAMGALFCVSGAVSVEQAMTRFSSPSNIEVRSLGECAESSIVSALGKWLRGWRSHGRSEDLQKPRRPDDPPNNVGFRYAKNDHDIGYGISPARNRPAYRPALGLPIIQRIKGQTNKWEWDWDSLGRRAVGRFASPVILRPYLNSKRKWQPLVIFVESHKWPEGKAVFINGTRHPVSLDLYEAMKYDPSLKQPEY